MTYNVAKGATKVFSFVKFGFAAFLLLFVLSMASPYLTHDEKDVFVTGTVVKNYDNESKYLIFTDSGVYENTDALSYLKFNSSDLQGALMRGGKFHIKYYGFRIPFLSSYPNITSVQRIQ